MGLNLRSVASEWVERPPLAARRRRSALKRLVRLSRRPPAACFGVNKPRLCCSACSPEGKKPRLQLEVLIKAFRGDYDAVCQGFVSWKWLGSDSNAWKPASKPRLCPNLYKREYLISCILSTFKDFSAESRFIPPYKTEPIFAFMTRSLNERLLLWLEPTRKLPQQGWCLFMSVVRKRGHAAPFFGFPSGLKTERHRNSWKKTPNGFSAKHKTSHELSAGKPAD